MFLEILMMVTELAEGLSKDLHWWRQENEERKKKKRDKRGQAGETIRTLEGYQSKFHWAH